MSLQGKTALITGSYAGIGYATAGKLAAAGCTVVLHGIEKIHDGIAVAERLAAAHGAKVVYLRADLIVVEEIEFLMSEITARFGGVDILVNNAVVRSFSPVEQFKVADWDRALAVNLSAAFHTIRLSVAGMRARGFGRIINMSSVYGDFAIANRIDYVTTKTALLGLTRTVALETIADKITCNAICPGAVHTPASERRIQEMMSAEGLDRETAIHQFVAARQPTGRFIDPENVAELILFLCGPAGRDITGAGLPIDGGWMAS
jgi:3-hydroxybutyrate dehydrogenase